MSLGKAGRGGDKGEIPAQMVNRRSSLSIANAIGSI